MPDVAGFVLAALLIAGVIAGQVRKQRRQALRRATVAVPTTAIPAPRDRPAAVAASAPPGAVAPRGRAGALVPRAPMLRERDVEDVSERGVVEALFATPHSLAAAFILSELLAPPVALRPPHETMIASALRRSPESKSSSSAR